MNYLIIFMNKYMITKLFSSQDNNLYTNMTI